LCVLHKVIFIKQFLLSLARTVLTLFQPDYGANLVIPVRNVQHRKPGDNRPILYTAAPRRITTTTPNGFTISKES
jgi:hypothetical protein